MASFCEWVLRTDAWLWAQTNLKRFVLVWLSAMILSFIAASSGWIGENGLILGCLGWPFFWLSLAVIWNSLVGHLVIGLSLVERFFPATSVRGDVK